MFSHRRDCEDAVDKVFNKKRADDRKEWLGNYDKSRVLNINKSKLLIQDFVDREMIHFSKYDCERSIGNIMDGLKISTRKITFSAFKRNLNKEIKVAQFGGYTSEHSCYHHIEKRVCIWQLLVWHKNLLVQTILILFFLMVNLELVFKEEKDHASERYIFTQLNPITQIIYNQDDNNVLNYLDDDVPVEPEWYAPIIPMVLVNPGKGIGTGFSYEILPYNPLDIAKHLKKKLIGETKSSDENFFLIMKDSKELLKVLEMVNL